MDLVVNEWLPEYFKPDASNEEKQALERFLVCFSKKGYKMVVKKSSPFITKIFRYAKNFQHSADVVSPIRNFIKYVLMDSDRCMLVEEESGQDLPQNVSQKLSTGNFGSDRYLFEAASFIHNPEKIIITTDARLKDHFKGDSWCRIILLNDFLENYCNDI